MNATSFHKAPGRSIATMPFVITASKTQDRAMRRAVGMARMSALGIAAAGGIMTADAMTIHRTLDDAVAGGNVMAQMRALDSMGNMRGADLGGTFRTHDNRTVDSTGAFLVGELERMDPEIHSPLAAVTWSRDIEVRTDVTMADEVSSFTVSTFASGGSLGAGNSIRNGKAWIGKDSNQIGGVSIDIGKLAYTLRPWALDVKFTILELESAAKLGRPIDTQKIDALKLKHQMDTDEQVYVGDTSTGDAGMLNHTLVTNVSNLPNGAGGSPLWANKTPAEILADVNDLLYSGWAASGYAVMPSKVLLPPKQYGTISTQIISAGAGNISVLKYLIENNIVVASGQGKVDFLPCKWLLGCGVGGTIGTAGTVDRMVAYTPEKKYVRFPMVPLQRTAVQFVSIYHAMTYYGRLGCVEIVYPETFVYRDGL